MCKKKLLIYLSVFSLCVALVCFTPLIASADSFDILPSLENIEPMYGNGEYVDQYDVLTNVYAPNFQYLQSINTIASSKHYLRMILVTAQNGGLIKDGYWNRLEATVWIRTNQVNIGATPFGKLSILGAINTQTVVGTVVGSSVVSGSWTGYTIRFEWTNHNDNGDTLSDAVLILGVNLPNAYTRLFQLGYSFNSWMSASSMAEAPIYPNQDGNNQELDDLENKEEELWQNNEEGLQDGLNHILGLNATLNSYASCFAAITDIVGMALGNIPILNILITVSIGFGVFAMLLGLYGIVFNQATHDYRISKATARELKAKQERRRAERIKENRRIIDSIVED